MKVASETPNAAGKAAANASFSARIVYQAYDLTGQHGWVYDQTLYSLLSLFAVHDWDRSEPRARITVFTDDPRRFRLIEALLDIKEAGRTRLLKGMGAQRFIHRLKLDLLLEAVAGADSPLVYFDGDVYFRRSLAEHIGALRPGRSLMHAREHSVWKRRGFKRLRRWISRDPAHPLFVPADAVMYNAGVIGLHPDDFPALTEALAFTDCATQHEYHHIWEQLAVSASLGRRTRITPVDDVVHHYWDQREVYGETIARCLTSIRQEKMTAAQAIAFVRQAPLRVPAYRPVHPLVRVWRKMTGRSKMISIRLQDDVSRLSNLDTMH